MAENSLESKRKLLPCYWALVQIESLQCSVHMSRAALQDFLRGQTGATEIHQGRQWEYYVQNGVELVKNINHVYL